MKLYFSVFLGAFEGIVGLLAYGSIAMVLWYGGKLVYDNAHGEHTGLTPGVLTCKSVIIQCSNFCDLTTPSPYPNQRPTPPSSYPSFFFIVFWEFRLKVERASDVYDNKFHIVNY